MKHWLLRASVSLTMAVWQSTAWADAYDAPLTYYNNATATTAAALRTQLSTILNNASVNDAGVTVPIRSIPYTSSSPDIATAFQTLDENPDKTTDVLLIYNHDTATKGNEKSSGLVGYNREHIFPASKLGGDGAYAYSDEHNLRPAQPTLNGTRGNKAYGGSVTVTTAGVDTATSQFNPGQYDRGDVARSVFYMATRYYTGSTTLGERNLNVIDAQGAAETPIYTMGDLKTLLTYHYQDLPSTFERRRNSLVYQGLPSSLSQGNRNPYVDHPEYVWAVFGGKPNESIISVAAPTAGASTKAVDFGRVIVGGTAPALSTTVAINKTGETPTTFSVTAAGLATTTQAGKLNAFNYAAGTQTITVGLNGVTTTTAGLRSGSVTVDNTDLTSSGSGTGSLDGNDTVNLSLAVLDHSNASFDRVADVNTLNINFQNVDLGKTAAATFSLANLLSASGLTAGLDLDSITATGDVAAFGSGLTTLSALTAGTGQNFVATFSPTAGGSYFATYTIGVSDEDLSGATNGTSLTLVLSGVASSITRTAVPEPTMLAIVPLLAIALRRRRAA